MTRSTIASYGIERARRVVLRARPSVPQNEAAVDLELYLGGRLRSVPPEQRLSAGEDKILPLLGWYSMLWLCPDGFCKDGKIERSTGTYQAGIGRPYDPDASEGIRRSCLLIADKLQRDYPGRIEIHYAKSEGEVGTWIAYEERIGAGLQPSDLWHEYDAALDYYPPSSARLSPTDAILSAEESLERARNYNDDEAMSPQKHAVELSIAEAKPRCIEIISADGDNLLGPASEFTERNEFLSEGRMMRSVIVSRDVALDEMGQFIASREMASLVKRHRSPTLDALHVQFDPKTLSASDWVSSAVFGEITAGDQRCAAPGQAPGPISSAQIFALAGGNLSTVHAVFRELNASYPAKLAFDRMCFLHLVHFGVPHEPSGGSQEQIGADGISMLKYGSHMSSLAQLKPLLGRVLSELGLTTAQIECPTPDELWQVATDVLNVWSPAGFSLSTKPPAVPSASAYSALAHVALPFAQQMQLLGSGQPGTPYGLPLHGSLWDESHRRVLGIGGEVLELEIASATAYNPLQVSRVLTDLEDADRLADSAEVSSLVQSEATKDFAEGRSFDYQYPQRIRDTKKNQSDEKRAADMVDFEATVRTICSAIVNIAGIKASYQLTDFSRDHISPTPSSGGLRSVVRLTVNDCEFSVAARLSHDRLSCADVAEHLAHASVFRSSGLDVPALCSRFADYRSASNEAWAGEGPEANRKIRLGFVTLIGDISEAFGYPHESEHVARVRSLLRAQVSLTQPLLDYLLRLPAFAFAPQPGFSNFFHLVAFLRARNLSLDIDGASTDTEVTPAPRAATAADSPFLSDLLELGADVTQTVHDLVEFVPAEPRRRRADVRCQIVALGIIDGREMVTATRNKGVTLIASIDAETGDSALQWLDEQHGRFLRHTVVFEWLRRLHCSKFEHDGPAKLVQRFLRRLVAYKRQVELDEVSDPPSEKDTRATLGGYMRLAESVELIGRALRPYWVRVGEDDDVDPVEVRRLDDEAARARALDRTLDELLVYLASLPHGGKLPGDKLWGFAQRAGMRFPDNAVEREQTTNEMKFKYLEDRLVTRAARAGTIVDAAAPTDNERSQLLGGSIEAKRSANGRGNCLVFWHNDNGAGAPPKETRRSSRSSSAAASAALVTKRRRSPTKRSSRSSMSPASSATSSYAVGDQDLDKEEDIEEEDKLPLPRRPRKRKSYKCLHRFLAHLPAL